MKIVTKVTRGLRRAATTRRAMPEIWFQLVFCANLAVPFSLWTENNTMLWLAAGLELVVIGWYAVGWKPVRKATRKPVMPTTRTRRAPARRKAA